MKKYLWIFIIAIILVVVTLLFFKQSKTPQSTTLPKIKFALIQNDLGSALSFIALDKDYFKQEGIEVEPVYVNSGKGALNAVLSNNADLGLIAETPLAFLSFSDQSVKIVSEVTQKSDHKVLARKDRGIKQLADLKGKRIGVPKGTSPEFALVKNLTVLGLNDKDFELVNLAPPSLAATLAKGDIDAYAIWEPHVQNGVKLLGFNSVTLPLQDYSVKISLAGKQDYISQNEAIIKKFLLALINAEQFLKENTNSGQAIITQHIAIDPQTLKLIWSDYNFSVQLTSSLLNSLQEEGKWINEQKLEVERKPLPNYHNFIYDQILKQINPNLIKI